MTQPVNNLWDDEHDGVDASISMKFETDLSRV